MNDDTKLPYSDEEIVAHYRDSRNKKNAITILCQMNMCQPDQIVQVLLRNGLSRKNLPRNMNSKVKLPPDPNRESTKGRKPKEVEEKNKLDKEKNEIAFVEGNTIYILSDKNIPSYVYQKALNMKQAEREEVNKQITILKKRLQVLNTDIVTLEALINDNKA